MAMAAWRESTGAVGQGVQAVTGPLRDLSWSVGCMQGTLCSLPRVFAGEVVESSRPEGVLSILPRVFVGEVAETSKPEGVFGRVHPASKSPIIKPDAPPQAFAALGHLPRGAGEGDGGPPYDARAMTTPSPKPETPPAGPTVCECGYDLTGLPVDDDAKCPECGVVISTIKPPIEIDGRTVLATTIAFMPSIVAGTKVCTCGYDLTGLPADGDTKCPECGIVLATIKPRVRVGIREFVLFAVAILPSIMVVCDPLIEMMHTRGFLTSPAIDALTWVIIGWFFFVSMPASVLLLQPSLAGKPTPERLMPQVIAVGLCFIVNIEISVLAMYLMM